MMIKIRDHIKNENGNIALLVMGSLVLMMVLFVFILNMGSVLATKEKSAKTAKQASLAATSVVYEQVKIAISGYDYSHHVDEDGNPDSIYLYFDLFYQKVQQRKQQMALQWKYFNWSDNERELKAIGEVIQNGLQDLLVRPILSGLISKPSIGNAAIDKARSTISNNGGTLTGAQMEIKSKQIHIKAANEFEATSYDQFYVGLKDNIYRKAAGPEVSFLHVVFGGSPTISLE